MKYPGYISMGRFDDGSVQAASVLRLVHSTRGVVSAMPVYSQEERAADPEENVIGLRVRNLADIEAWPIRDVYEACAMAHLMSSSTGRPFVYLWDYDSVADCEYHWQESLIERESEVNEEPVIIGEAQVAELRDKAWGSQYEVDSDVEITVSRHGVLAGRLALIMSTVRDSPGCIVENLVVRYRGTPRRLLEEEVDEVLRACYDAEGVSPTEVDGPWRLDENGYLMAWKRRVEVGPRAI